MRRYARGDRLELPTGDWGQAGRGAAEQAWRREEAKRAEVEFCSGVHRRGRPRRCTPEQNSTSALFASSLRHACSAAPRPACPQSPVGNSNLSPRAYRLNDGRPPNWPHRRSPDESWPGPSTLSPVLQASGHQGYNPKVAGQARPWRAATGSLPPFSSIADTHPLLHASTLTRPLR